MIYTSTYVWFTNAIVSSLAAHISTKLMHTPLFYLLSSYILAYIDIWLSGLEHRDKFKHVISRFKYMSNPVLFAIRHNLGTPYHNFGAFRWYNKVWYDWAHRRILAWYEGYGTQYEYYTNKYEYITQLTPQLIRHCELCKSLQQLSRDENLTIPYFEEKIPDYDD